MANDDSSLRALGSFIREQRTKLNLTQTQLAERLGWSQERISILESGKYGTPSLPALVHLAEALEVPVPAVLEVLGYPMTAGIAERATPSAPAGNIVLLYTLQRLLAIDAMTLKDALDQASDQLAVAMGADKIDAFTFHPESNTLIALGTSNTPMGRLQHQSGLDHVALANRERTALVYETGEVYYTGDAQNDAHIAIGVKETLGVRSLLAVPLRVNGEVQGVIVAESSHQDRFSAEEQRFFIAACRWVAMVAHRAEMIESMRQVEAAEARRLAADEVISTMTHDLEAFLTPLRARLDILSNRLREQGNEQELEQAREAAQAAAGIEQRVNRLLDVARLDQGLLVLRREPVDLAHLVQNIGAEAKPDWPDLVVRVSDVPVVTADPRRVREVLVTLLANAIGHSPDGAPITVGVGCEQRDSGEWVVVSVSDEGPGIASGVVSHLFERFSGDGQTSQASVDLYLAHRLVEAQGGTLTVESAVGKGSTFWVALPATR